MNETKYLISLTDKLLSKENRKRIVFTKDWLMSIPSKAGVYLLHDAKNIVYVGETGNLKKRMKDMFDSRHHTLRRTIGHTFYSHVEGFCLATSKMKFPDHIEVLVTAHLCKKLYLYILPVSLGRKELEEYIDSRMMASVRLNKRSKRK